jgi:hypothetical protein
VLDHVQARRPLVVGSNDVPRGDARVGLLQHDVPRPGVVVPALTRREVHRTQFPLTHGIVDTRFEPALLLVIAHFEPELDQDDAAIDDELLDLRTDLEKPLVLLRRAESHHVLDTGAVVPAAIENHHLAGRREVLHVALHVHLRFFAIGRRRKRDDAEDPGAHTLGDRLDRAALAGAIASLEDDDDAQPFLFHVLLEMAEAHLQLLQRLLVLFSFHQCSPGRRAARRLAAASDPSRESANLLDVIESPRGGDEIELHGGLAGGLDHAEQ